MELEEQACCTLYHQQENSRKNHSKGWSLNTNARLFMLVRVSGCSIPNTLCLITRNSHLLRRLVLALVTQNHCQIVHACQGIWVLPSQHPPHDHQDPSMHLLRRLVLALVTQNHCQIVHAFSIAAQKMCRYSSDTENNLRLKGA